MKCEHQAGCGFYQYLASQGKLVDGGCGKEAKEVCPRFREASGEHMTDREKGVFKLTPEESIYKQSGPLTHEETSIAFRDY